MKIRMCDLCLAVGVRTPAGWVTRWKRSFETTRLDCCAEHRAEAKRMTYEQAVEMGLKAAQQASALAA